jgi:cell division septation protein DedD
MSWNTGWSPSVCTLIAALALCSVVAAPAAAHATTVDDGGEPAEASDPGRTDGALLSKTNGTATPTGTTNDTATPTPIPPTSTPETGSNGTATPATMTPSPSPTASIEATGNDTLVVAGIEAPEDLRTGDRLVVNATVRNPASDNATGTVRYSFDDAAVASETVTLGPGESTIVGFDLPFSAVEAAVGSVEPGTYVHGVRNASGEGSARWLRVTPDVDLAVGGFDAPVEVTHDEPYIVLATVTNPGNTSVTRQVTYEFAGRAIADRAVTVAGNDDRRVAFEIGLPAVEAVVGPVDAERTYDHGVATGDDRGGGAVRIVRGSSTNASALAVESFEAADGVRSGESYVVTLTVRNVDTAGFEGQLSYRVDGAVVATEWARVPIGERRTVGFRLDYDDVVDATYPLSAQETEQGVFAGDEALVTRPVSVHAPVGTATPRPTPTFGATRIPRDAATPAPASATTTPTPAPDGETECERGFITACGGTAMDETSLTLFGVLLSGFGIVYEMVRGRR